MERGRDRFATIDGRPIPLLEWARRCGPDGIVAEHLEWNVHRAEWVDPELRADLVAMARDR